MKRIKLTKKQADMLSTITESDIKGGLNRVDNTFKKEFKKAKVNGIFEDENKIPTDIKDSVEVLKIFSDLVYKKPSDSELSKFYKENNVTWKDLTKFLKQAKILGLSNGIYRVANVLKKKYTSKEEKLADLPKVADLVKDIIKKNASKIVGTGKDNEQISDTSTSELETSQPNFTGIAMNKEVALLNGEDAVYMFDYADAIDGDDIEVIAKYVNQSMGDESKIKIGDSLGEYLNGTINLVKLSEEVKEWLRKTYDKDKKFIDVLDKLMETTTAASSGAFTGPFMGSKQPNKDLANPEYTPAKQLEIVNDEEEFLGNKTSDDIIEEVTAAGSPTGDPSSTTTGQYVQPAIWAKDEKNWRGNKKTQYPGGEMVKFDSCTKLNNNKKAQSGKCSQGAADSVVKTYKTKDSVISKNTSIYEEIANKTGKTIEEVKKIIENKLKENLP
jgi:hypothetical protein